MSTLIDICFANTFILWVVFQFGVFFNTRILEVASCLTNFMIAPMGSSFGAFFWDSFLEPTPPALPTIFF